MRRAIGYTAVLLLSFCLLTPCAGQGFVHSIRRDSVSMHQRALTAVGEVAGLNMVVWAYDRFIPQVDFAYINGRTILNNFENGFEWDSDQMGTNFIMHPYHGSLYFNAARSNGFNFYESIPFAAMGSLMWEFFFENEYPSINDLFATTFAGAMYGEVTYRLSNKVLDNSATGANRVFREILGAVFSPVHGINRLITGEAWKRSPYSLGGQIPVNFNFSVGCAWLKPELNHSYLPYTQISTKIDYNPEMKEVENPYDWFSVDLRFNAGHGSFYVSKMGITGVILNKSFRVKKNSDWGVGLYQHFDYWDSPRHNYQKTPYRFAQVVAAGPGVYYKTKPHKNFSCQWNYYLTGIGLGGALSDYYWVGKRDYSFGSGFSTKTAIALSTFDNQLRFNLTAGNYTLYTWKGYHENRLLYNENLTKYNVQGDAGHTNFTSVEGELGFWSKDNSWNICLTSEFINRHTMYRHYNTNNYSSWNFAVKAGYTL